MYFIKQKQGEKSSNVQTDTLNFSSIYDLLLLCMSYREVAMCERDYECVSVARMGEKRVRLILPVQ